MKLKSSVYETYIEHNNEWVAQLPSSWAGERVKNLFRLVTETSPPNHSFELLSLYASIGVRPRKELEQRGNKAVSTDGYWLVKKGDIVVNKLLAWMGSVGLSAYDGVTSPAYDVLRKIHPQTDARFFAYLFRTELAQAIFKRYSRGIMEVRLRLYFDKLGAIVVPTPPYEEQQAIADYLDEKTSVIDQKITLLTEKAAQYAKLKQSLINETVTRGLDKTVPMKESGIDWIGRIPAHWKIVRVKDQVIINPPTPIPNELSATDEVDFLPMKNVDDLFGKIKRFDTLQLNLVAKGYTRFQNEDVIFAKITPCMENGNCAVVRGLRNEIGFGSTEFFVLRSSKDLLTSYLYYFLFNELFRQNAEPNMRGTAGQKRVTTHYLSTHKLLLPPLSEQKVIVKQISQKLSRVNKIVEIIHEQIENLKELRKSLINDVVTGKIKVVAG